MSSPSPTPNPCTVHLHLGRDSYQGDTSHELCFGIPQFRRLHQLGIADDSVEFDHPTGRKGCTLPLPDWFVHRLFGRLLAPGEVQPVDVTIHPPTTVNSQPEGAIDDHCG